MPTPVNHLIMAREVLERGTLAAPVRRLLLAQYGPFLLGHTAPDVQTVSGQRREETHFYTLPPRTMVPASQTLLDGNYLPGVLCSHPTLCSLLSPLGGRKPSPLPQPP